jgi:hypothetical protein
MRIYSAGKEFNYDLYIHIIYTMHMHIRNSRTAIGLILYANIDEE